jgi:pimeloyl-ACP methyl ester carboxylesterase
MPSPALLLAALGALAAATGRQGAAGSDAPAAAAPAPVFETVTRKMRDGVVMTADHYAVQAYDAATAAGTGETGGAEGPRRPWGIVVALHQQQGSRGEFRGVAPELNRLGLEVLAVDLRCGKRFVVENETAKAYQTATHREATPADAYDDIDVAVRWARELVPGGRVVLFGSASSASLALVYAAREKDAVDAVFAFSPGEYVHGWDVYEEVAGIQVPVYVTCGPGSKEAGWARGTVSGIDKKLVTAFYPPRGMEALHGVSTLLAGDAENRERQWKPVRDLLERLKGGG